MSEKKPGVKDLCRIQDWKIAQRIVPDAAAFLIAARIKWRAYRQETPNDKD